MFFLTTTTLLSLSLMHSSGDAHTLATTLIIYTRRRVLQLDSHLTFYSMTSTTAYFKSGRQLSAVGTITTVAGNGSSGFSGNGVPVTAAKLNYPRGVAFDASGNIFIADTSNHVIQKFTKISGLISTVTGTAGVGGYTGDISYASKVVLCCCWCVWKYLHRRYSQPSSSNGYQ